MKNCHLTAASAAILIVLSQSGCSSLGSGTRPEIIASYTRQAITIDGKLNEVAWHKTPSYSLVHAEEQFKNYNQSVQNFFRKGVAEPGKVRLLWDDKYLYVGFEFTDLDIIAEGIQDQKHHYQLGDTAEVFLKPLNKTWYWELYATPGARKTAYFFPGRGLLNVPSCFPEKPALTGLKVAAFCKGTLNKSWDKDKKWTAEMAIPRSEIDMAGEKLDPEVAV